MASDDDDKANSGKKSHAAHHHNAVLPARMSILLFLITAAGTVSLLVFFYRIRISFKPSRFAFLDAEQKNNARGDGLEIWEALLCLCIPVLTWRFRWQCTRIIQQCLKRKAAFAIIAALCLSIIRHFVFRPSMCGSGDHGWINTDVGYIRKHSRTRSLGVSMRTLCDGRVWEPHVARAIDAHLYGQGRAIDVGAFVGYHTVRLAKGAAPFDVYAFEGRPSNELNENLKRNNAMNVRLVDETIDETWTLSSQLQNDLLNEDKGPLAFVKIDCEGCEMSFLKGTKAILERWHPVLVIEIQDDDSRRNAVVGGQQMIKPSDTRNDVLDYLRNELGYTVEALRDDDGVVTWDYLAWSL